MLLAIVAVGVTGLAIVAYETDLLRSLELSTVNTRFSIRGTRPQPRERRAGRDRRDDLRRTRPAVAVPAPGARAGDRQHRARTPQGDRLRRAVHRGQRLPAAATGSHRHPGSAPRRGDEIALLEALSNAGGRTVMATTETTAHGDTSSSASAKGTRCWREVGSRAGQRAAADRPGRVLRRVSYSVGRACRRSRSRAPKSPTGRRVDPGSSPDGSAWIDYDGPDGHVPRACSFSSVYAGQRSPRASSATRSSSSARRRRRCRTCTRRRPPAIMPGAEIQANAIETVLRGLPLRSAGPWVERRC